MEFKNEENKSSPHSSNYGFLAQQTRLGGHVIPDIGRDQPLCPNHVLQLQPYPFCSPGQTTHSHDVNETSQRELEKRMIREEIIMSDMIRRRELEAEVRRELLVERQLALRQMGSDGFRYNISPVRGFDSSTRLALPGISLENEIAPFIDGRERHVNNGVGLVPFQRGTPSLRISEVEPVQQAPAEKKKIILLAKPAANTSGAKRKAEEIPPAVETNEPSSDIIFKKKAKEEWKCGICHISCTSEIALKDHLIGKKHKSKQAAAITRGGKNYSIGLVSTNAVQQVQVASEPLKNELGEINGNTNMYKFWCNICKIGANAKKVMKNHESGKKHLSRLTKHKNTEELVNKVDEDWKGISVQEVADADADADADAVKVVEAKDDSNAIVEANDDEITIS